MLSRNSFDQITQKLSQLPANAENWEARHALLRQLDALFGEPASENNPILRDFYRQRCRQTIREIRAWDGPEAKLWKCYSSGVVIKDGDGSVTAFDLNDGCTPKARRTLFLLGEELTEEFSELIDTAFYTHGHPDHIGPAIAGRLLAHGKKVIAPLEAIQEWRLVGAISAEEYRSERVRCYPGIQRMTMEADSPNSAYLFTLRSGATFFVRGDIYFWEDFLPILDRIKEEKRTIDFVALSPFHQSGPSPVTELDCRFHCRFLTIHEWEFSHRLPLGIGGSATQTFQELHESFRVPGEDGRCACLGWGESMLLESRASISSEVNSSRREVCASTRDHISQQLSFKCL